MSSWKDNKAVIKAETASFDEILKRGLEIRQNHKDMVLVHCSAGIGRTGTLIALMLLIESF